MRNPGYRLAELTASGFKSIRETEEPVRLSQLNVLIGANGSGKSNFIGLLNFLQRLATETLQNHVGQLGWANAILFMGTNRTQSMAIAFQIEHGDDTLEYRVNLNATADDHLAVDSENIKEVDPSNSARIIERVLDAPAGRRDSVLRRAAENGDPAANAIWAYLSDLVCFHFHDPSRLMRATDADFYHNLYPDGSNLASFLLYLRERFPAYYRRIVATVRLAAPFFDDFVLEPEIRNPDKMFLRWKQVGADYVFHGSQLSDGTLRFAALAAVLSQPNPPATIVIDEPELGLHPAAINVLGGLLQSASVQSQIIVSTQSVTLLDNFAPEDVVVLDLVDNASQFRRLDSASLQVWLEDYSLGEIWEKNVVGGRP